MSATATTAEDTGGSPGRLPKLREGDRKKILAQLICTGLGLAVLAGMTALFMTMLLNSGTGTDTVGALIAATGLVTAALGIGGLRALERVLAERLGQSYVQQIRVRLVEGALTAEKPPAAGITIARSTNDLTSIRNWVALGIAPLAVGIPLILGAALGLSLLNPLLGLAALVPLLLLGGTMILLARTAFERAKVVRRRRGRLASLLADTVSATATIRAASGERREIRRIGAAGQNVVDASIARSKITGYIRGAAAGAAAIAVAAVGIVGLWQSVDTAVIAGALTIVGLISTPVSDLGRVVEYRQNFKAARRILEPALRPGPVSCGGGAGQTTATKARPSFRTSDGAASTLQPRRPTALGGGIVSIIAPPDCDSCAPSVLLASPGDTVLIETADPARADSIFEAILGLWSVPGARVVIDGVDLLSAESKVRRELVGYAAAGSRLERGTVERAVRYRRPDLHEDEGNRALDRVELADTVRSLPKAGRTQLRRGGSPLNVSQRARLLLARAALADPPLLMLNRIDTELDDDGVVVLENLVANYPGVALIAVGQGSTFAAGRTGRDLIRWTLECTCGSTEASAGRAEHVAH